MNMQQIIALEVRLRQARRELLELERNTVSPATAARILAGVWRRGFAPPDRHQRKKARAETCV